MRKGELLRTSAVQLLSKQFVFHAFCCRGSPGGALDDERSDMSEAGLREPMVIVPKLISLQISGSGRGFKNLDEVIGPARSHEHAMATTAPARVSSNECSPCIARSFSYNLYKTRRHHHGFSSGKAFYCTTTKQENVEAPLKVVEFLNSLRNFDIEGVPKGAGTESSEGFDLGRMARLLQCLGDPLSKYPVRLSMLLEHKGRLDCLISKQHSSRRGVQRWILHEVQNRTDIAGSGKRSLPARALFKSFVCTGQDLTTKVYSGHHHKLESGYGDDELSTSKPVPTSDAHPEFKRATAEIDANLTHVIEAAPVELAILAAARALGDLCRETPGIICVTGSLHAVAETFSVLSKYPKCQQRSDTTNHLNSSI